MAFSDTILLDAYVTKLLPVPVIPEYRMALGLTVLLAAIRLGVCVPGIYTARYFGRRL